MDSDAKELGHVRVARSKDRFGLPGLECDHAFLRWQQCSQSKIAHDSLRVRDTSTPTWCDRPVEGPACRPTLIRGRSGGRLQQSTKTPNQIKDATRLKALRRLIPGGETPIIDGPGKERSSSRSLPPKLPYCRQQPRRTPVGRVALGEPQQEFRHGGSGQGGVAFHPRRRVRRAPGPFRMRQDHHAPDDRRLGRNYGGEDLSRWPPPERCPSGGSGYRDGVPELRALPSYDRLQEHGLWPEDAEDSRQEI